MDTVLEEFEAGMDSYWAGETCEGWENPDTRNHSPFVAGWFMASMSEVDPTYLLDRDGELLFPESGDW